MDEFQSLVIIVSELLLHLVLVGVACSVLEGAYYSAPNAAVCGVIEGMV